MKSAVKDNAVTTMHVIEYIQKYHPENEALMSKVQAALEEKEEENEKRKIWKEAVPFLSTLHE